MRKILLISLLLLPVVSLAKVYEDVIVLTLAEKDIEVVTFEDKNVSLMLSTSARDELLKVTSDNVGKRLMVVLNKTILVEANISAPIESGVVVVSGPSAEQKRKLVGQW